MKKIVLMMVVSVVCVMFLGSFSARTYDEKDYDDFNTIDVMEIVEITTPEMLELRLIRNFPIIRNRLIADMITFEMSSVQHDTPKTTTNPETSSTPEDKDVNPIGVRNRNIEIDDDVSKKEEKEEEIVYEGFDPEVDYGEIIIENMLSGNIEEVKAAIEARNLKIVTLGYDGYATFSYEELNDLARIIQQEAGSSWLSMEWKMGVGEVVLNRVSSPEFADTIHDVIASAGQYGHDIWELSNPYIYFYTHSLYRECIEAALRLFNGERVFNDPSVVFQSQSIQGRVCQTMIDYTGSYSPTYFCYSNNSSLYQIN